MSQLQHFVWSDALLTGVPAIDVQHKELIVAFNDLADAIEQGLGPPAIKKILVFLEFYAGWHFEREEKCADECLCPCSEANRQAHKYFVETFQKLRDEYRQNGFSDEVARKVHHELSDWIVNHVLKMDKQIGVSYAARQDPQG